MLQKQSITIPLGLGVNTKTDEKLVEQGAFNLVCENATFEKVGAVKKRLGYNDISTTYYEPNDTVGSGTGTISSLTYKPTCLATLNKSIFMRNQIGEYLYTHNNALVYKDSLPIPECKITSVPIYSAKTSVDVTDTDYDPNEDIITVALRDGYTSSYFNGSKLVIFDNSKKTTVTPEISGATASGSYYFGFCRTGWTRVAGESYYYHIYTTPDQVLHIYTYNKYGQYYGATTVSGTPSDWVTEDHKGPIAVCRSDGDTKLFIIVPTTTSLVSRFICISGATVLVNTTWARLDFTGWGSATARYDSNLSAVRVAFLLSNTYVREIIFNEDGTVHTAENQIFTVTTGRAIAYSQESNNISFTEGASGSAISGRYYSGLGVKDTENYNTSPFTDTVSVGGVIQSVCTPVALGERAYFVMPPSTLRAGTKLFARIAKGLANSTTEQISRCAKISDNKYAAALPVFGGSNGSNDWYNLNLYFIEINQDYKSNSRAVIGRNLHLSGGFVSEFDGERLMENGFHLTCPPLSLTAAGTGLTGTYSYRAVLKHIDKNGQITRSAPSSASDITLANQYTQLSMLSMPFGVKPLDCQVEVYRTTNGGSVYYLVKTIDAEMYFNNDAWITTEVDNLPDTSITDNTILYTSGNVLDNDPGPACKSMIQGGNRLFLFGLEDENEIAYSKKKLFGEVVNFSDFLRMRIDTSQYNISGGCIAGGYMDGKLIIGKENSLFYVAGDGPNELGVNDTFTVPELISSETGITDPRSVVLTPMGLMFKGKKGIYLLDRSLGTQYIGSPVEEYNDYNVTSVCHLDEKNQVIFSVINNDATKKYQLVFDYFTQQWSVYSGVRCLDADVLDGTHAILESSNGHPMLQDGTDFLDNASAYSQRVVTPWIKVSGIQDFARIWRALIIGEYKSAHTLNVKVRYNYETNYEEEYNISPQSSDSSYQYEIHLKKQKCESVQFEIQDTSQVGESMELTALTLEVGLRKGTFKIAPGRKY